MRYNAFFGELPLNAFKPRPSGGMTLEGGNPITAVTDAVSDVVSSVADVAGDVVETVGDVGKTIDQTVRDVLPGGWTTAALLAAGYYYQPEIAAFMNAEGATVPLAEVADAGAVAGTSSAPVALTGTDAALADLAAGSSGFGAAAPATAGTTLAAVGNADKAALYGDAGYGAGMTGAQTGAYDAGLAAGAAGAGSAAGGAGGAGGSAAGSSLASMLPYMTAAQVGTGLLQANAANKAADVQSAAADRATQVLQQNLNTINAQQAPQRAIGYTGGVTPLGALGSGTYNIYDASGNVTGTGQGSGYLTHQFDASDLAKGLAPNYDFMLQQGQMANQRAANVAGGGFGGNAMQGLNKFTQDYAGNAYQNAFNNYQSQRRDIYNTLAGIAGIGQTGQNQANTAATNTANAVSSLGVGSAGAQAAGQIGQTNALGNTANNIIGNYTLASLLNQRGNVMG